MNIEQFEKVRDGAGFIAALDQSGGSTPKALSLYGVAESSYASEEEMFDLVHLMRSRIITNPSFTGERLIGSILFEMTMDREIDGRGTAEYLWQEKNIVPFVKVDLGLADEVDGARLMKPIPGLDALLQRAIGYGVFGTKMRSVISRAIPSGVAAVVDQQFDLGRRILDQGLVPIIEPEIDINSPDKLAAELLLKPALREQLDALPDGMSVLLKLTLPDEPCFYSDLVAHPRVLRVVALSGGYSRLHACDLLALNPGVVASFSRALTEGLSADQSDEEFTSTLNASIQLIYEASMA
ncbi:MAG: fructose bisphosphate aldolase [Candidatus Nanopelagicales bacterium]|jgi:fructose-bisphosphate aldolase, class I|nr:fructose bisphosphate aldolase [Candidatus Nanopelagicales bacterium]